MNLRYFVIRNAFEVTKNKEKEENLKNCATTELRIKIAVFLLKFLFHLGSYYVDIRINA